MKVPRSDWIILPGGMGIFEYVAVLTSIIIGLGIAHLLRGMANLIQHPGTQRIY